MKEKFYRRNKLADPERKLQIQKVAELFLMCFELHNADTQEELEEFFFQLPSHDRVQREMAFKMREACDFEVSDYE